MQIQRHNWLRDIAKIVYWFPVRWLFLALPFSAVRRLSKIVGGVDHLLSTRGRRARMVTGLSRVFGEGRSWAIMRENLQQYCRCMMEFTKYPQITPGNIDRIVTFAGLDRLDDALRGGKGVVLVTAHFVGKQILQVGLGHKGYKINQINYNLPPDELSFIQRVVGQRQRMRIEERIPARFIPADGYMREVFRCLQSNEIMIVTGDGSGLKDRMSKSFVRIPFFDTEALFPRSPVAMARKTGATLVPAFVVRDGARHRIVIESPLEVAGHSDDDIVRSYARVLEEYIRRYPELWEFWEEFMPGHLIPA